MPFIFVESESEGEVDRRISLVFQSSYTNILYDLNNEICLFRLLHNLVIR